jgi:pimeloyl-ACP methyl ester carboxylesterase
MKRMALFLVCAVATAWAGEAAAETVIYVHGWNPAFAETDFQPCQDKSYCDKNYFGYDLAGGDRRFVGWNTYTDNWAVFATSQVMREFNLRCRKDQKQSCVVICHSAGCAATAKALDKYGASGTIWNITRVLAIGSAEGGSELAQLQQSALKNWFFSAFAAYSMGWTGVMTFSLTPSYVRGNYDHNDTATVPFFHVAGHDGWFWTYSIVDGEDDGVVGFHSSCGYVKQFESNYCSNDWEWAWKSTWWGGYYVQRTVSRWSNHNRVEYCGRDGCNKDHIDLLAREFYDLALKPAP